MKRVAIILFALALLGGGFAFFRNRQASSQNSAITTASVKRADFVKSVSSSGKTAATESVDLKFQTSGKLAWVNVKEGDEVVAYTAIAGLDPREVQKNLEKALRDYLSERNDFEETWRVTYQGRSSPNQALNDTIKRILEKNQWDLEQAVLDVELKHLAVEYATLVTPIAGIVAHVDTPVAGVNITPATAVFSIVDPNSLVFEASVDETDIAGLTVGQAATIVLDSFPDATFSGTISTISYISEQSSGGATVFPVKIAFEAAQNLRVGLNGDIIIETNRMDNVLTVPTEAIREDKGQAYVYKKSGQKFEKIIVTTGPKNEDEIVIINGLNEGDTIVIKGFASISK